MGWLAMPLGALPGWTHGSATTHHRGRERARLALLTERQALVGLVGRRAVGRPRVRVRVRVRKRRGPINMSR